MGSQWKHTLFAGCWSGRAGRKAKKTTPTPTKAYTQRAPPVSMAVVFDEIPEARPRTQTMVGRPRASITPRRCIAADRIFANYELTENILSNLSLDDLVKATAVSSQWHGTILTSKALRTRLLEERIPSMISTPDAFQKHYNISNGHNWFFRIQPSSLYDAENKICVIIFRTLTHHIELLISRHQPKVVVLDPARTRLFGSFAGSIWRVDGYDVNGEVAWKDLCGVYCEPSVGLCSYAWRYLLPGGKENRQRLEWEPGKGGVILAKAITIDAL